MTMLSWPMNHNCRWQKSQSDIRQGVTFRSIWRRLHGPLTENLKKRYRDLETVTSGLYVYLETPLMAYLQFLEE